MDAAVLAWIDLAPGGLERFPGHVGAGGNAGEEIRAGGVGDGRELARVEPAVVVQVEVDLPVRHARLPGVAGAAGVAVVENGSADRSGTGRRRRGRWRGR